MAEKQVTVTVKSLVSSITIDPTTNRLTVAGAIQIVGAEGLAVPHSADVTDLLSPEQVAACLLLIAGAQAWIDTKLP